MGLIMENCPHEKSNTPWCINCKTTEHWSDEYKKCPKYAEAQDILKFIAYNGGTFKEIKKIMNTTQQKPTYADTVNKPVKNLKAEKEVTPKPQNSQTGTGIKRKASDISPDKGQNQNKDTYFGIPIQNRFSAFNRMDTTAETDSISDKPPTLEIDADWTAFNLEMNKTVAAAETVSSVPPSPKPHPVLHPHLPKFPPS